MVKNKINLALIAIIVIITILIVSLVFLYISCQSGLTACGNTISDISEQLSKCKIDKNNCTINYETCQSELQKERNYK